MRGLQKHTYLNVFYSTLSRVKFFKIELYYGYKLEHMNVNMTILYILLNLIFVCPICTVGYESNYQQWSSQQARDNIQKNYTNTKSGDIAWLGMLDPLNLWFSAYSSDPITQQLAEQGIATKVPQGLSSLLNANPVKVNNNVTDLIGTSTPKQNISKIIIESFYEYGYKGAIIDGATNIITGSWTIDNTEYDMVTLMSIMSDASETNTNPNGFFVYNSQTKTTIANLAYGSQVVISNKNAMSIRQPIVFNATEDVNQEYYNFHGTWNYTLESKPVEEWGYTLNVPVGAMTFYPIKYTYIQEPISYNITTISGTNINVSNTKLLGTDMTDVVNCSRNTAVNTHIYDPSAMGTGLWATNGFGQLISGCAMTPDYVAAVHGEGSICTGYTFIVYRNITDGLLSFVIPSLTNGNWVVKPADELLQEASNGNQTALKCIDFIRGPNNDALNIIEPPLSPFYLNSTPDCIDYGTNTNVDGSITPVIIEYAGPNARLVPRTPISDYIQLESCINNTNIPGNACFDPGLSRTTVNVCQQSLRSSLGIQTAAYDAIIKSATSLQQQTATSIVQLSPSSFIPDIIGGPTSYGAITALIAAGAAVIALDAKKIYDKISVTLNMHKNKNKTLTLIIITFVGLFTQLPLIILCIQAFRLDGKTGFQYTPSYDISTDIGGDNVYLIMQISAVRLTYNTPLLWLYPTVLAISIIFTAIFLVIAYNPIRYL